MASVTNFEQIQKSYLRVFIVLMILTVLTVGVTTIHFGNTLNIVVGVLIAVLKATLVIWIFMHLKYDNRRLRYFVYIPAFFFLIFVFALTLLGL